MTGLEFVFVYESNVLTFTAVINIRLGDLVFTE
jgi:hypothetical protein